MEIQSNYLGDLSETNITSNILKLNMYSNNISSINNMNMTIKLPNIVSNNYFIISNPEYLNVTCQRNIFENHTLFCNDNVVDSFGRNILQNVDSSGTILNIICNGTASFQSKRCPIVKFQPECKILNEENSKYECKMISYDTSTTTCFCTSKNIFQRYLSDNGLSESSIAVEVVTISNIVVNDFIETILTSDELTLSSLEESLIVILMYSIFWGIGLISLISCIYRQKLLNKQKHVVEEKTVLKKHALSNTRTKDDIRQFLATYVDELFPSVFQTKPYLSRLLHEITKHHRYLVLFTSNGHNSGKQRFLIGVQLLTIQSMLMFMLAVFYDFQFPSDDGTCQTYTNEKSCLHEKSPFDVKNSVCRWKLNENNPETYHCVFPPTNVSIEATIVISIVVAIFTAPINLLTDFLFIDILSAPSPEKVAQINAETGFKRAMKRLSVIGSNTKQIASNTMSSLKKRGAIATRRTTRIERFNIETTRVLPDQMIESHSLALESSKDLLRDKRFMLDRQLSMKHSRKYQFLNDNTSSYQIRSPELAIPEESILNNDNNNNNNNNNHKISKVSNIRKTDKIHQFAVEMSKRPVEDIFNDFITELQDQRQKLRKSQLELYDSQWGLTATGNFIPQEQKTIYCNKELIDPIKILRNEFNYIHKETELRVKKLEKAPNVEIGMEILHMFILDLLGRDTPVAKIFLSKAEQDFRHSMVISNTMKGFAWFLVILLNLIFVYFSILRGIQRGISWQRMYLGACILQFIVEFLFYETSECILIHFIIPDLARNEVRSVGFTIHQILQNLWISTNDIPPILNVPSYLYLSYNVANFFPDLLESIIIRSYVTYSPGELAKKWKPKPISSWLIPVYTNSNSNRGRTRYFTITALIIGILQKVGSFSPTFQRVTIHLLQPIFISGLILLFVALERHPLYFIAFGVILSIILFFFIREVIKEINENKEISNIHPIQKLRQSKVQQKIQVLSSNKKDETPINLKPSRELYMNQFESKDGQDDVCDDNFSLNFHTEDYNEYPNEEFQQQFVDDDPNNEFNINDGYDINDNSQDSESAHQFFSSNDLDDSIDDDGDSDDIQESIDQYYMKSDSERDLSSSIMDGNESFASSISKRSYQSSKYVPEKSSEEVSQYHESYDDSVEFRHKDEWNDEEDDDDDDNNSIDLSSNEENARSYDDDDK